MTDFVAPRWMRSAHVQTMAGSLPLWSPPRSFRAAEVETLLFPLPEGGGLNARAWWQGGEEPRLTAIVIHGVGGSIASRYVVRGAVALYRAGFHVVRLDLRGAGDGVCTAPSLSHAGLTADPRAAVDVLGKDPRVSGIALVGFSLGGHVALRLAGEWGDAPHPRVRKVVSISAPVDLGVTVRALETAGTLPYRVYVLHALVRQALAFSRLHPDKAKYDTRALFFMRQIREYDAHVIAPMHGFRGIDDYYARASAGPWLAKIGVPTVMLHATDDPMVPRASLTPWLGGASRALRFVESASGGHVGWFGGVTEESWTRTWAMERTIQVLNEA